MVPELLISGVWNGRVTPSMTALRITISSRASFPSSNAGTSGARPLSYERFTFAFERRAGEDKVDQ